MDESLLRRSCVPCRGGVPPMNGEAVAAFLKLLEGWEAFGNRRLRKTYPTTCFAEALEFVNRIGVVAEREGHHPDLHLSWWKVGVEIWTHKIDGLTESDFILAAKIDALKRA